MGTMSDYFRSFKENETKKTEGQTPSAPAVTVNEKSSSTKISDYFRSFKEDETKKTEGQTPNKAVTVPEVAQAPKKSTTPADKNAEMLSYNLINGAADIEKLSNDVSRMESLSKDIASAEKWLADYEEKSARNTNYRYRYKHRYDELTERLAGLNAEYGEISSAYGGAGTSELNEKLRDSRLYHHNAERYQNLDKYTRGALDAEDFAEKSGYVSTKVDLNDPDLDVWSYEFNPETSGGYTDLEYEYINKTPGIEDVIRGNIFGDKGYEHMTPEQVAVFNYYYATEGRKKAMEYLDLISDELTTKLAAEMAKVYNNTWREPIYNADAATKDAVVNMTQGISNLVTGSYDPVKRSAESKASELARRDNTGLGKLINDAAYTTGYMAPSIGASILSNAILPGSGAVIGAGVMGASSAGGAYDEMIQLGYSANQARAYGVLVGASEASLQYLLGGISKLGGKATGKLATGLSTKLDDVLAKVAINHPALVSGIKTASKLGVNVAGEITEEELQLILEPLIKTWVTGEAYLAPDFEEMAYTAIVTALSTVAMEGPSTVAGGFIDDGGAGSAKVPELAPKMPKVQTETDNIPIVPTNATEVMPTVPTATNAGAEAAKAFSQYAQGVFEDIDNDTYEPELMSDPEIADAVSDMDVGEGNTFTPSDGVIQARDVHEDFRNTGKFIPDTPTQEFRKAEAAKAKNDIQRSGILAGASKADIRLAEIMSALTGRNVIFESDDYRINGYFDGDNTIFVNTNRADGIFAQVLAHELTHSVEGTKAYAGIVKAVRSFVEANTFTDNNGVTHDWNYYFTEAHAEQDEMYPKLTGKPFTDAKADAEVVAKVIEGFFADNAADAARTQVALDAWLAETVKTNRSAVSRMWYKLSQMAKRIRSDIKDIRARKAEGYDAAARERELMLRRIEDIRDRFGRALMEAKKAKKAGDGALSVNNSFSSEINDWEKAGMPDGEKFVLGSTGDVLQGLGAIESDIYMNGDKIKTILNEHSQMTLDEIKKIPQILENPVLILKSKGATRGKRNVTRLVMFGTVKAKDGLPILSVLDLRPDEGNFVVDDMQKVVSAYTKDVDPEAFLKSSDVLYVAENEKITTRLLRTIGLKMPIELNRSGYIGSISYNGQNVNISGEKFSNVVTLGSGTRNNPSGESFSYNPDSDYIGTKPINDAETANRKRALEMYRQLDAGKDIGNGNMDPAEYIYMQTGWAYDGLGNFIVDHEAPIYIDSSEQHRMANRRADHAEGVNNALRSENEGLREDVQRWKSRTAAAEDAAKRLARDWRLSKERKLSADYVPSREQVRGIVNELGDMLGGGFSDVQIREYTNRLLDIYDRMGHDGKLDLTNYTSEIVALIDDMQSVEFINEDNKALADSVRPELQVPVFLSEKARGDFANGYGKTAKAYRGKVNFVSKANGTPVDVRYMELSERFPNLFPADITNEADQAKKMLEVADRMREEGFTTRDRYSDVGAEPDVVRSDDLAKAIARIVEGYEKLETKPRTFADGLLRTLEYERREHKRELARMTEEERAKAEAKHNKEVERLLGEAEAAMEWETEFLKRHLSEAEGKLKAINDDAKADAEAKARRAHLRGKDIEDAAIKAAKADGSFTSIMTKLHERHTQLENELAKVQAQCDKYAKVKASQMSRDGGAYVKQLREHRDQLAEDLSNLTAYINKVYQRVKSIRTDEYVDMIISDGNLADWKDKKIPLSYQIETMRRNILDSKPKNRESKLADHIINDILDPIVDATAQAISVKNEIRDRVRKLDLSTKVRKGDTLSESQFVQALGEAQSNIEALDSGEGAFIYNKYGIPMREGMTADEWRGYLNRIIEENPSITKDESNMKRMEDAVKEFKDIYDQLFTIVNAARVRNGYAPVPYHRGYFPHYNNDTKQDGILSSLFEGLGFRQSEISEKLPTSINGLTATFRPGIRYMSNAKQRSLAGFAGEPRVTGAVEGIDRYLETAADVAFMTDHIQNLRSLSDAIRYATTTDATKKRIEEINADDTLSRDEKRVRKDEIFANRTDATKYALNHLVPDIEEYANILSGKKSRYDRTPENLVGRSLYTTGRKFMSRVASNQIVLNVGSWITNTVPLTTGTAVMHYNMLTGLADTIKGAIADDGFAARSTFLTSRRGSDRLVKSGMDMASEIGGYGMTWVDQIVSEWLMRARVRQNMSKLGKGMSEAAAIAEADKFISGMMAQRTKAEMPTIFASQNPLAKMFTMYQLEVKNNLSFLFKDMPREYKDETVKLIVKMFAIFLLSRIYNDYYEELTGRRPSFDPLEMLNDLSGDLSGYKIASADDFFRGKFVEKSEKKNAIDAFTNLGKSAAQEIPFVGGLLGGGRVPISSAMPDWEALGRALKGTAGHFYGEDDPRSENAMGINNIIEELYNGLKPLLYYGATPLGGGQLKKVVEGGVSLAQGGSYNYSTSGASQLQYPMYTDEKDGIWNAAKAIVFGKTATSGGREWVEGGFGQLSAKRTAVYEELVSSGASQRESFEAVKAVGGAGSKQIDKARALLDLELDDDAKLILFSNMVTESAKKIESAEDSIQSGVGIDTYLEGLIKELEEDNADSDTIEESSKSQTKSSGSQYKFNIPEIKVPEVKVPKVEVPKFNFNFK